MKKFAKILTLCLALGMILMLGISAAESAEPTLALDKESYTVGDEVVITASGDGEKDWVGIWQADMQVGTDPSLQWYYVQEHNGEAVRMSETTLGTLFEKLPAGEYVARYLLDDGYDIVQEIYFFVNEATEDAASTDDTAPAEDITPAEDPAPAEGDLPVVVAPATADAASIAVLGLLCAAGVAVVLSKKR